MRVVVVGATGNLGTSVLRSLAAEERVESVLGIARRIPEGKGAQSPVGSQVGSPKVEWASADVTGDDLEPHLRGADAIILLSWLIQPSRDLDKLWKVNVEGSTRVMEAVAQAGVPALLYASSVGAYSPGPKDRRVDESWPTGGVEGSYYSRQKAEVERRLECFERENTGGVRVARLRPGLVFKREASQGIRRLFGGPMLPGSLARPELIKLIPRIPGLRSQVIHSYDVGEAFRLALLSEAGGAFNLAAEPPLDASELGRLFGARTLPVPESAARAALDFTWRLRLHPVSAGWLDMARSVPLMDTSRVRTELGWEPAHDAYETVEALLAGLRTGAGEDTPVLSADSGPLRSREFRTGVGAEEP